MIAPHIRLASQPAQIIGEEEELSIILIATPGGDGDAVLRIARERPRRVVDDDGCVCLSYSVDRLVVRLEVLVWDFIESTTAIPAPDGHPLDAQHAADGFDIDRLSSAPDGALEERAHRVDQLLNTGANRHIDVLVLDGEVVVHDVTWFEAGEDQGFVEIEDELFHGAPVRGFSTGAQDNDGALDCALSDDRPLITLPSQRLSENDAGRAFKGHA